MDPESAAFQPHDDLWGFQSQVSRVQQNQAELSERISRLERKHEEDTRLKNVWGTSSPFPTALGAMPQQEPLQHPIVEHFSHFDGQSNNLIGNLQLDGDEEPRRIGAPSRANSVRFDETANPGHWTHASRSSLDLIPRIGSGMGHVMSERSFSHKSEGRQSSAGHSVHSATSGRANSFTSFGPVTSPGPPGLAPGLFILGPVPAIIRCWLNTDFKHDALLYAAVCSGSYTSSLELCIIDRLGFRDQVLVDDEGVHKIKLPVYLPEAVPVSASSRSCGLAPHLPSILVDFTVIETCIADTDAKAVQIFLGSNTLREHHADIMFSSNQLTLYDDDRSKLQIPLVRPEDERTFKSLSVASHSRASAQPYDTTSSVPISGFQNLAIKMSTVPYEPHTSAVVTDADDRSVKSNKSDKSDKSETCDTSNHASPEQRPYLSLISDTHSHPSTKEAQDGENSGENQHSGAASTVWGNWRRESLGKVNTRSLDWASIGRSTSPNPSYQRRDTGKKVLKPSKPVRPIQAPSASAVAGLSRFFDDGKQRGEAEISTGTSIPPVRGSTTKERDKDGATTRGRQRAANPVGGASAFVWLNNGGSK